MLGSPPTGGLRSDSLFKGRSHTPALASPTKKKIVETIEAPAESLLSADASL